MGVAIVAACRIIAERAIKIMASQAHRILHGENHIVMRNGAVLPVASRRNPGPGRSEVTLAAFSIQIMTGTTFKGTGTVKPGLIFVQPVLSIGMGVAIVAVFRSGSVRTGQLMALKTNTIGLGQAEFFVGDGAMLPIHSIWNFAA